MKKKIKAISLDIDQTITEVGGRFVPWSNQEIADLSTILKLLWQIKKIRFFFATGRPAPYIEAITQVLGIVTDMPSLFENGVGLYWSTNGKYKFNPKITSQKIAKLSIIKTDLISLVRNLRGIYELGKEYSFSTNPPKGMKIENYYDVIRQQIKKKFGNIIGKHIEITHSQSAVDITIFDVNKKTGLEFWCNEQGIKVEELAAIGDSRGDWPVLKTVALPMCPANSTEETKNIVKRRGGYISPFPTIFGTIDCIAFLSENSSIQNLSKKIIQRWKKSFK
ncbi:MAG TPA: HAD hydrolase family protein [Candidatus Humimicrobiaceae bacterium]|nr:HAD hydrolase family protein [Candidatus Humimicrobiaceae bacterium]